MFVTELRNITKSRNWVRLPYALPSMATNTAHAHPYLVRRERQNEVLETGARLSLSPSSPSSKAMRTPIWFL
jgi:hypothetical protein